MTDLTDARDLLVALLSGPEDDPTGIRAVSIVPTNYQPPIVWVAAGSPFRQRAQTVGKKKINLVAVCLGGASTNDETEARTEALAEQVAKLIDGSTDFGLNPIAEIEQPRLYPAGQQGQSNLGIAVNCYTEADR